MPFGPLHDPAFGPNGYIGHRGIDGIDDDHAAQDQAEAYAWIPEGGSVPGYYSASAEQNAAVRRLQNAGIPLKKHPDSDWDTALWPQWNPAWTPPRGTNTYTEYHQGPYLGLGTSYVEDIDPSGSVYSVYIGNSPLGYIQYGDHGNLDPRSSGTLAGMAAGEQMTIDSLVRQLPSIPLGVPPGPNHDAIVRARYDAWSKNYISHAQKLTGYQQFASQTKVYIPPPDSSDPYIPGTTDIANAASGVAIDRETDGILPEGISDAGKFGVGFAAGLATFPSAVINDHFQDGNSWSKAVFREGAGLAAQTLVTSAPTIIGAFTGGPEIAGAATGGAAAAEGGLFGAEIGTSIFPVIGTLIGLGAGALAGVATSQYINQHWPEGNKFAFPADPNTLHAYINNMNAQHSDWAQGKNIPPAALHGKFGIGLPNVGTERQQYDDWHGPLQAATDALNTLQQPKGHSSGGEIRGPGSSTGDEIPAWLSNGEFVVNAASARANGPLLRAINGDPEFISEWAAMTGQPVRSGTGGSSMDHDLVNSLTNTIGTAAGSRAAKGVISSGSGELNLALPPRQRDAGGRVFNFNGMDPTSAANKVERINRRRTLA